MQAYLHEKPPKVLLRDLQNPSRSVPNHTKIDPERHQTNKNEPRATTNATRHAKSESAHTMVYPHCGFSALSRTEYADVFILIVLFSMYCSVATAVHGIIAVPIGMRLRGFVRPSLERSV